MDGGGPNQHRQVAAVFLLESAKAAKAAKRSLAAVFLAWRTEPRLASSSPV